MRISYFTCACYMFRQLSTNSSRTKKSHYDLLGITPKATQAEIKAAYYKLSMVFHPDKTQNVADTQKFRDITSAYEILGNVKTRKLYDRGLYMGVTAETPTNNFYKSREMRTRPPSTGRTPIYDFDEWSRNHYGATFQRDMEIKRKRYQYRVEQEIAKNEIRMEKFLFGLGVFIFLCVAFFPKTEFDDVRYVGGNSIAVRKKDN